MNHSIEIDDYCACFIDLLGQKTALSGQGMMPPNESKEYAGFQSSVFSSVDHIRQLHEDSEFFFSQFKGDDSNIPLQYDDEQINILKNTKFEVQRWSDGMVLYTPIEKTEKSLSMLAVFQIFMFSGIFCFLGLAKQQPLRGGVEFSWGWEREEGEIYGAVVANAYAQEKKAELGRISVGPICASNLERTASNHDTGSVWWNAQAKCAKHCNELLLKTDDGIFIDYLGETFKRLFYQVNPEFWEKAFHDAVAFINIQVEVHRKSNCDKLLERYIKLSQYFDSRSHLFS